MKKLAAVLALITTSFYGFAQDVNKLISQADVEHVIKTLSADDMQGRATFTPGIEKSRPPFIESEVQNKQACCRWPVMKATAKTLP